MTEYGKPSPEFRKAIQEKTEANASLCWSCSACDSECPVFIGSSSLRPQKVLRMANLGLLDDLVSLPEIWYCLACGRCTRSCPNDCEPETVIGFLIKEAISSGVCDEAGLNRYKEFFTRFQRVRWQVARKCMEGVVPDVTEALWEKWLAEPIKIPEEDVVVSNLSPSGNFLSGAEKSQTVACFTCSECTNACPICFERSVFDPQWIFRMVNLGMEAEILKSPSIWLCLECQTCTDACSQKVSGHTMIKKLQDLALSEGAVDPEFKKRWISAQKLLYPKFTREIDKIFGFKNAA